MIATVTMRALAAAVYRREHAPNLQAPLVLYDPHSGKVCATDRQLATTIPLGTPVGRALLIAPAATVHPLPTATVSVAVAALVELLFTFSDCLEPHMAGNDWDCYLNLGHLNAKQGCKLADKLRQAVKREHQLAVQVGLARGKFSAWVAARHTDSVAVFPPTHELTLLGHYPVTLLPLKAEALRRLELFGITRIEDFAALPIWAVTMQFGAQARLAHQLARGCDARPVLPYTPKVTESAWLPLDDALHDATVVTALTQREATRLLDRALRQRCAVQTLTVTLTDDHGTPTTHTHTPFHPIERLAELQRAVATVIAQIKVTRPVREISVQVTGVRLPKPQQLPLFPEDDTTSTDLTLLTRDLTERYGAEVVQRLRRHRPNAPLLEQRVERVS